MREIYLYAGWLNPPAEIETLFVDQVRGSEHFSFSFNSVWLAEHPGIQLDPDLQSFYV